MLLAMSIALATAAGCSPSGRSAAAEACLGLAKPEDKVGGPLTLTSHTGARVTQDSFKGRKTFVFFGFTHCPDACPDTLFRIGTALRQLPKDVRKPKTALISVDPARDTPEELARYIRSNGFPEDIVGLTGSLDELKEVASAFATRFERVEDADSVAGYTVNHGTILYLMDENWKLAAIFGSTERPDDIARCVAALN
jgi:protein SCO1/2